MEQSIFSARIANVRAVKEAVINIDGITVLTGINGCGKSTLSKLIYGFLTADIHYDELVDQKYFSDVYKLADLLNGINSSESIFFDVHNDNCMNKDLWIKKITELNKASSVLPPMSARNLNRLRLLYKSLTKDTSAIESREELYNKVQEQIVKIIDQADQEKMKPSVDYIESYYMRQFQEKNPNWKYQFFEYGKALIVSKSLEKQKSFVNVIYIDIPYEIEIQPFYKKGTSALSRYLQVPYNNTQPHLDILAFIKEIIHGDVEVNKVSSGFVFKTDKGDQFDLSQCATGLKSFAVLDLLCKNGYLNPDTLLIIDEPEVHLHPQWIVDYVRLLVYINKTAGTKFLIATHNPDFVSAMRYISQKQEIDSSLSFYLGEEDKQESGKFTFRNLGKEIEPIFESFNIALDRINEYGCMD